uniref:Retrotransposon protein, putative, unclassified n=1 Tax=Oryza sativa subsp. japonica TaxID=39947 RepID=Q10JM7_ORYSJ|nr:retrotransposon protein, putative, unclassified [Oryza sativa Japonica Group]
MDLGKSTSTTVTLKKLQEEGALPGRDKAEREAGVLNFYGLSLLHLNPSSIAFLSVFVHLCEAYIGVEPFLDLFRFYYELRWMEPNRVSGCVGFRLRDGMKLRYVPFQCPSSRSKWRNRWFYLEIKDSNPVLVVPVEQPDKILVWTAKPPLTPSLQSFIDIIDDLRERGLSGYEVVADFVGLSSDGVERRVGQVMISDPTTASDIPVPLCERGAVERDEAINVAASLKEKVVQEASDAATTSGGKAPTKARKFSSVLGNRRKAETPLASDASPPPARRQRIVTIREKEARSKAARGKSGGTSSASPVTASTDVVPVVGSREATPSDSVGDPVGGRGLSEAVLTWEELHVEMGSLLEAGARGVGREVSEARAETAAANARAERLVRELAEAREDLMKMRELVAGNERQSKGLEDRMSELGDNLSEIRGSLRVTYTGLHQLAVECGVKSMIPENPDEFSLTSSLAELASAMGEIPSKHAARIAEETSNGIYTEACHVLACVKLSRPELDLREVLDQGAASDARKEVMEEIGDLGESVLPLFEEDADDEDVQQRGQPESLAMILVLEFEPRASHDVGDETLDAEVEVAATAVGVFRVVLVIITFSRSRGCPCDPRSSYPILEDEI